MERQRQGPQIIMPKEQKTINLPWIADINSYTGNSERIKGIRKIHETIRGNPIVETICPFILVEDAYNEFQKNGMSDKLQSMLGSLWEQVSSRGQFPLIVRRLFSDQNGISADGPRTGPVNTPEELLQEVEKFYTFYQKQAYAEQRIKPEIYVHRIANAAMPPKQEKPFLPYPGGDATPLSPNKIQIRATFGADESVQGFPADVWEVNFDPSGAILITQLAHTQKNESVIPWKGEYRRISIPDQFQNEPALNSVQVLAIATASQKMQEKFGPHRFEFNQVRMGEKEPIVVIEATPFIQKKFTKEEIAEFVVPKTKPIIMIYNETDFDKIPEQTSAFIHLPISHFQGNERRKALTLLAIKAAELNTRLVVFASGNIATQHAVRVLLDNKHLVLFVGKERFTDDEPLKVFTRENMLLWERINPFVTSKDIEGRALGKIGGKARGIHKLEKNGYSVPSYFVIESTVLRQIINDLGLFEKIQELDILEKEGEIEVLTKSIQEAILGFDLSTINLFSDRLEDMLKKIDGTKYSVRSSANCEDNKYSFAGIFHSELNVMRQSIQKAILSVLVHTYTSESVRAAKLIGLKPSEIDMAVIVQKMIDAKKSGTLFTKDVASRAEGIMRVEAVKGLGEQIVGGTAEDHQEIIINKKTKGIKTKGNIILSKEEIDTLISIGIDLEKKLNEGPQDIEWAISKEGKIYLLQTRKL